MRTLPLPNLTERCYVLLRHHPTFTLFPCNASSCISVLCLATLPLCWHCPVQIRVSLKPWHDTRDTQTSLAVSITVSFERSIFWMQTERHLSLLQPSPQQPGGHIFGKCFLPYLHLPFTPLVFLLSNSLYISMTKEAKMQPHFSGFCPSGA